MCDQGGNNHRLLMDAHVHIHDCFRLETFFDSAFLNFRNAAVRIGCINDYTPVLFLTEGRRERWFERLMRLASGRKASETGSLDHYRLSRTHEPLSLSVRVANSPTLFLLAGRQVVTKENLEVLALLTEKEIPEGWSLGSTLESVLGKGGIPVLPWGFGKWMGRRGKILDEYIRKGSGFPFFLGDNSGRPAFLPQPPQFGLGEENGIRVLPGSDPLPFASECHKPGSFGFAVTGSINFEMPGDKIRKILLDPNTRPNSFGRPETAFRFLRNQMLMQIVKYGNRSGRAGS